MKIKQFFDEGLAHNSYAIASEGEVALIDPARNPRPYLDFAEEHKGNIRAVFETHPHADFISSHREFHEQHGVTIYINERAGATYPHQPMNHEDETVIGKVRFRALFTPGHSPDHNTYLLIDEEGIPHALFTGDALLVGDVGRPDLREGDESQDSSREALARQMYQSIQQVFKSLENHLLVYPAHGAGSLCGRSLSSEPYSTLGAEKKENWAFTTEDPQVFVEELLTEQPFIPLYFPYNLAVNRRGARPYQSSLAAVPRLSSDHPREEGVTIVDVRDESEYKAGHWPGSLNIQVAGSFETWLGSIIPPKEPFYIAAANEKQRELAMYKTAKIGYEPFIQGALLVPELGLVASEPFNMDRFRKQPEAYTIVDVRNRNEYQSHPIFSHAQNIPLAELSARIDEVNTERPIVVHCASGYRSAIGFSILERELPQQEIFDLSDGIKEYTTSD